MDVDGGFDTGPNQGGTYGTEGTAASSNVPGARYGGSGWVDGAGNFWLFGGEVRSTGTNGQLNDLWSTVGVNGRGSAARKPETRTRNLRDAGDAFTQQRSWGKIRCRELDRWSGQLRLFGGNGAGLGNGGDTSLNDLWEYNVRELDLDGRGGRHRAIGTYGTEGTGRSR